MSPGQLVSWDQVKTLLDQEERAAIAGLANKSDPLQIGREQGKFWMIGRIRNFVESELLGETPPLKREKEK